MHADTHAHAPKRNVMCSPLLLFSKSDSIDDKHDAIHVSQNSRAFFCPSAVPPMNGINAATASRCLPISAERSNAADAADACAAVMIVCATRTQAAHKTNNDNKNEDDDNDNDDDKR